MVGPTYADACSFGKGTECPRVSTPVDVAIYVAGTGWSPCHHVTIFLSKIPPIQASIEPSTAFLDASARCANEDSFVD